jgi:hypothetical protein
MDDLCSAFPQRTFKLSYGKGLYVHAKAVAVSYSRSDCRLSGIYGRSSGFSLALCEEVSQNIFGSEAGSLRALDWPPPLLFAQGAGALNQRFIMVAGAFSPPICDGSTP